MGKKKDTHPPPSNAQMLRFVHEDADIESVRK
jgi:hypothetical protein